ncbi:hypothetical protein SAMN05216548_108204 [Faunimonas pinastri]|uniref:Uncharacterized protein n=1 Tax=Faunimonas pinastri TaxID=1855383 RepID=A0A1H9JP96_9HYPH|nr:hypothetical protein [Faunimonas pinastri]SEQ88662.1 hypothetical protein SAMN05216548_108204 [Faunimonas pinastri]
MARFEMQMDTAHGVLFLADSGSLVSIPSETNAVFVTATDDCLAFWVMHYVDGASIVTITDEACQTANKKLFSGSINAQSGVVTLTDSSAFRYLNVPVPQGPMPIEIWAEDDKNPEWVWIQIAAIRSI